METESGLVAAQGRAQRELGTDCIGSVRGPVTVVAATL